MGVCVAVPVYAQVYGRYSRSGYYRSTQSAKEGRLAGFTSVMYWHRYCKPNYDQYVHFQARLYGAMNLKVIIISTMNFIRRAEGGWGGSSVNYSNLQYKTTNSFLRLGFNKSVLVRDRPDDWDMMFIGLTGRGSKN